MSDLPDNILFLAFKVSIFTAPVGLGRIKKAPIIPLPPAKVLSLPQNLQSNRQNINTTHFKGNLSL